VQAKVNAGFPTSPKLLVLCSVTERCPHTGGVQRRLHPACRWLGSLLIALAGELWVDFEAPDTGLMKTGVPVGMHPVGMHYERCRYGGAGGEG
jgi:hypothetical protein